MAGCCCCCGAAGVAELEDEEAEAPTAPVDCFEGALSRERKISPKFFRPKFFHGRPRGMSVPKCLFSQDLEGLTEVFGGMSGRKLPLWAEFSFLTEYP